VSVAGFLAELRGRDIHVWADGERLRCNAPAGRLAPELRDELGRRKGEILAFLQAADGLVGPARRVVPLQPRGARAPIFAVAGHNGDVFCYRALARELGEEQPFFGLEPPGLDGRGEPLTSVSELAADFAAQIGAVRPGAPCVIAGFCAGGAIALELARQLLGQGTAVRFVALFAGPYPTAYRRWPLWRQRLAIRAEGLARHRRALARLPSGELGRYLGAILRERRARRAAPRPGPDPMLARRARVEAATIAALRRHTPAPFAGRVALFLPSRPWLRFGDTLLRWRSLARDTEQYPAPDGCTADHMLQEPHVHAVAELFRRCRDASGPAALA
jgi:thioesterase domain-containing protein